MKSASFCVLLLFTLSACRPVDSTESEQLNCKVVAVGGPTNSVDGTWKLIRRHTMFYGREDMSCDDIYFHFKRNGRMIVESKSEKMRSDTTAFEFSSRGYGRMNSTIRLNGRKNACNLFRYHMTIDRGSELDGEVYYLARIK